MADITFEQYKIDLLTLACERLLSQFNSSTTGIQPYLNALVQQTQDWNEITQSVFIGRFLDTAVGIQLDKIGRLIGQSRPLIDGTTVLYFEWDNPNGVTGWDGAAGWFSTNAPITGLVPINDTSYRLFIKGKVFKNQVTGASIPEIIEFIKLTFTLDASVITSVGEIMAISIAVPIDTPLLFINFMLSFTTDSVIEKDYFLPIANGVRLVGIILLPEGDAFGWDGVFVDNISGWDSGKWSITIPSLPPSP